MHLFPASYKEYLLHIDSYLSPAYQVENGGGLYKIPETSLYIAQVDSCHEEDTFVCTFSYDRFGIGVCMKINMIDMRLRCLRLDGMTGLL